MNIAIQEPASDYETVRRVIEIISTQWRDQPQLEEIARLVGMPSAQLQKTFTRWAGLTDRAFFCNQFQVYRLE